MSWLAEGIEVEKDYPGQCALWSHGNSRGALGPYPPQVTTATLAFPDTALSNSWMGPLLPMLHPISPCLKKLLAL